jgi:DNA gyrase/topoisomerase IV subunit B
MTRELRRWSSGKSATSQDFTRFTVSTLRSKTQQNLDEILVNAADNYQRDPSMNMIKIDIKPDENKISVWNNGKGIPIQMHKDQNCYVPEMIFG